MIYITGILEFAGAFGLVKSITGVTVGSAAATPLVVGAPLQLFWIGLLWWSTNSRATETTRTGGPVAHQARTRYTSAVKRRIP